WVFAQRPSIDVPISRATLDSLADPSDRLHVELAALSRSDVGNLASELSGRTWNLAQTDRLHTLSGGNPLHVRELVRAHPTGLPAKLGGLPASLDDLVGARLAGLPSNEFEVLATAALCIRPTLATLA